jgi:hypothetical protein
VSEQVMPSPAELHRNWRGADARAIGIGTAISLALHLLILQHWRIENRLRTEPGRSSLPIDVRLIPELPRDADRAVAILPTAIPSVDVVRRVDPSESQSARTRELSSSESLARRKPVPSPPTTQPDTSQPVEPRSMDSGVVPANPPRNTTEPVSDPKPGIQDPLNSQDRSGDFSERALEQFRMDARNKSQSGYRNFGKERQPDLGPPRAEKDAIARHFENHLGTAVYATDLRETIGTDGSRMARVLTPLGEYCLFISSQAQAPRQTAGLRLAVPSTCPR